MNKILIESDRIYLRQLDLNDNLTAYLSWVNDKEATTFMEIRNKHFSSDDLRSYIKSHLDLKNYLCGIFEKTNDLHIGNVLLSDIDDSNKNGVIGIFIGKKYWGKGFGTEAVNLMCEYGFDTLKLYKIIAGVVEKNHGSAKLFSKAGFALEGIKKEEFNMDGKFLNTLYYGKIKKQ